LACSRCKAVVSCQLSVVSIERVPTPKTKPQIAQISQITL
jgi:hypothetical protein